MDAQVARRAGEFLWTAWQAREVVEALPAELRPRTDADGFAIQRAINEISGQARFGWKIAATSAAGQQHIGVSGPLPGTLLAERVRQAPATFSLDRNAMRVAETEFAFRMGRTLAPRAQPYAVDEVLDAVAALHPAIEVPDSRYRDFVTAGGPQIIADNACACWFALGEATTADWRSVDLSKHPVRATIGDRVAGEGTGANVLGDPRVALTWLANALSRFGTPLSAGEVVTTGTCVVPVTVQPGETVVADFGPFGRVEVSFE
ncbi:MAG: fumarylacetoacetate hydrolase family protein [Burkholderiales bacterium]